MIKSARNRSVMVWCTLLLLTFISLETLQGGQLGLNARGEGLAVITVAFVKARIIALEYMELRFAPLVLRLALEVWITTVWLTIGILYWISG